LPYIDLNELGREAAVMLLKTAMEISRDEVEHGFVNVQTVHNNYEGYTKCKVLKAKEALQA
jgi:hypothetical protein